MYNLNLLSMTKYNSYNLFNVPLKIRNEFFRFLDLGKKPSGFLYSILCNDLAQAVENADEKQKTQLIDIVCWVQENAPNSIWGSESRVIRHLEQHSGPRNII